MSRWDSSVWRPPTITWRRAVIQAVGVNAVLVAVTAAIWDMPSGADNPLPWLAAWALQFPASLLLSPLIRGLRTVGTSSMAALAIAGAIVVVVQCIAWAVFFRRPWRSRVGSS